MKTKITYKDIVKLEPCYDPITIGMKKSYSATPPEFIKEFRDKVDNEKDIIWLLCRKEYMTDKNMRLFAVWCARKALKLNETPDERSINACNVAECFANGEATNKELSAARSAAESAERSAAWSAAESAARNAQIDQLLTYFE